MEGENTKPKILIFGGTGYLGKYMVKASVASGHKTFVYARPVTQNSRTSKVEIHKEFQGIGVTIIERFLPSEFGCEESRVRPLPPFEACLETKRIVRRAIEAAQIPYTFVSANLCGAYFVNVLLRPSESHDDVVVYGSGEAKAVFNYEEDIAKCTIKVINDPRTCNRIVIYRPQASIISQLELISLWEQKTGWSFKRVHVSEEELVKLSETIISA